jgi:hypothetical protein
MSSHGVNIKFVQAGQLGQIDFQTTLLNLVAGFALLATANTATDFLMIYILKAKKYYYQHKYEVSMDFSEIRRQLDDKDDVVEESLSPFELTEQLKTLSSHLTGLITQQIVRKEPFHDL